MQNREFVSRIIGSVIEFESKEGLVLGGIIQGYHYIPGIQGPDTVRLKVNFPSPVPAKGTYYIPRDVICSVIDGQLVEDCHLGALCAGEIESSASEFEGKIRMIGYPRAIATLK